MQNPIEGTFTCTLESRWHDNDGDEHEDSHTMYLRFYPDGFVFSRGGNPASLGGDRTVDRDRPETFSMRGVYNVKDGLVACAFVGADGEDEQIDWSDTEIKYSGSLRTNDDFLGFGIYWAKLVDDSLVLDMPKFTFTRMA